MFVTLCVVVGERKRSRSAASRRRDGIAPCTHGGDVGEAAPNALRVDGDVGTDRSRPKVIVSGSRGSVQETRRLMVSRVSTRPDQTPPRWPRSQIADWPAAHTWRVH